MGRRELNKLLPIPQILYWTWKAERSILSIVLHYTLIPYAIAAKCVLAYYVISTHLKNNITS